ncbi:MAG: hypothetical protein WC269_06180, partial [Candidatus Gracilibacteria bacterium]
TNKRVLNKSKIALTYWDQHFDNFIVSKGKIVGVLDFERISISSIDYALFLVRKMVSNPKKYASIKAEKYVKIEDYSNLMEWYKKFYPALFHFDNIEKRLDFYSIERCLDDLYYFPKAKELITELLSYLK